MYRLTLLGGVGLHGPSGPLSGRIVQGRQAALLALLALRSGTPLTRDKAAGLLWGARPEAKARARLSDTLYVIRCALGERAIVSLAGGLRLNGELVRSDAAAFEEAAAVGRWREAAELYTGPFLDGFHLGGAAEFERWVDGQRRRLSLHYREALETLAEAAEAEADFPGAVVWWKERAAEEPTNSSVALRLMRALAADGNVAGAVEHARVHELRLREELCLPLPEEVRALAEGLVQGAGRGKAGVRAGTRVSVPDEAAGRGAEDGPGTRRERAASGEVPSPPTELRPASFPAPADRRSGRRKRIPAAVSAAAALAILAAGWFFRVGGGGEEGAAADAPGDRAPVIVVLPFENLGTSEDAHFADGITAELTVRMASVPGLRVIAGGSALQYGESATDIRRVGEELGVDYALAGTLRWEDRPGHESRLRVTTRLVRASDGTHVWAESYEREPMEIFAVQSEIAQEVASALNLALLELPAAGSASEPTGDLQAYDHYLQGQSYIARQFSPDAARAAIGQWERAVDLDPEFAGAWRRLIHARLWLVWVFGDEEAGIRAGEDLERLLELEPDDPEVRLGRAWFLYYGERRYEQALREFEAVRESRPGDGEVLRAIGFLKTRVAPPDGALATMREALETSPRDAELAFAIGHVLRRTGRYDEAERYYERAIALAPDMGFGYMMLHAVRLARGDTLEAREARDRARRVGADPWDGGRPELYRRDFPEAVERIRSHPATERTTRLFRYDALADAHGRMGQEGLRAVYADSLLELASGMAPEHWDQPREQVANLGWLFSGLALIHLGEADRGLEHVRRGLKLEAPFDDALTGSLAREVAARAFVRTGRLEEAMEMLEEVRAAPADLTRYDLSHDPEWDPVRDHPRFEPLLEAGPRGGRARSRRRRGRAGRLGGREGSRRGGPRTDRIRGRSRRSGQESIRTGPRRVGCESLPGFREGSRWRAASGGRLRDLRRS